MSRSSAWRVKQKCFSHPGSSDSHYDKYLYTLHCITLVRLSACGEKSALLRFTVSLTGFTKVCHYVNAAGANQNECLTLNVIPGYRRGEAEVPVSLCTTSLVGRRPRPDAQLGAG